VSARRSNEGASSKGAAEEQGVTTSDQPSGDRRGLEVDEPVDHRRSSVVDKQELLALASDFLSDAP